VHYPEFVQAVQSQKGLFEIFFNGRLIKGLHVISMSAYDLLQVVFTIFHHQKETSFFHPGMIIPHYVGTVLGKNP
jgi:hypothetical protein